MFKELKVAQIAAYFLHRAGGAMPHLKLMKLMYLADREALGAYNATISGDTAYSMRLGPVLSRTLDFMGGHFDGDWSEWITPKANWQVGLQREIAEDDLDELSDAEMRVLRAVHDRFGAWDKGKLIDYTHGLKEWRDPGLGRAPITPEDIFEAMGKDKEEIEARLRYLQEDAEIDAALASLSVCG
jgi:uncharacterized phage-associated protein